VFALSSSVVVMTMEVEVMRAVAISRYSSGRRGLNVIVVERELLRAMKSDCDSFVEKL
jgi:hypothetical protein